MDAHTLRDDHHDVRFHHDVHHPGMDAGRAEMAAEVQPISGGIQIRPPGATTTPSL